MSTRENKLKFGAFFAPFHNDRTNPTFALEKDMDLIQHMDQWCFDEAWIGEHHSGAYECIASPEVFIAGVAERTRNIRLGTGVSSLSYHHPLILADRIAQLDHQTRGRIMFGTGPGQLIADAYMMGVDPTTLRERMGESLDVLVKLLRGEVVTCKTSWFELNEARMHILPYQDDLEVLVASAISPSGARLAGQYGAGMLSVAASSPKGFEALADSWAICEDKAIEYSQTVDRKTWRIVCPVHIAETREQARKDLEYGLMDMMRYFRKFGGSLFPEVQDLDEAIEIWTSGGLGAFGVGLIGTPDDLIARIDELEEQTGGFGSFLVLAHNAANYEATKKSYELIAQYVMPRFQGSNKNRNASLEWAASNADRFMDAYVGGISAATLSHELEELAKKQKAGKADSPVRHVTLVRLKDGVSTQDREAALAAFQSLPQHIPEIKTLDVGADLELLDGNYDIAVHATFATQADFLHYAFSRAQDRVVFPACGHLMAEYSTAQISLEPSAPKVSKGIKHVTLIKLKSDTTKAQIDAILSAFQKLPDRIPEVQDFWVGGDLGLLDGNAHVAVHVTFESKENFLVYSSHAAHQEIVAPVCEEHMDSYATAQMLLS